MNVLWFYTISSWTRFGLIVGLFVALALVGVPVARIWLVRYIRERNEGEHNDLVNNYLSIIGVFYGLTIGLIAVEAWGNLSKVQDLIAGEAAAITKLYRDSTGYPPVHREKVRALLVQYIDCVVEKEWPAQRHGQVAGEGYRVLDQLYQQSSGYEPTSPGQQVIHAEYFRNLNEMTNFRRMRLTGVADGIPEALWAVIWVGAVVLILLTYLFWIRSVRLHLLLNASIGLVLGILVFVIVSMDHPYWGNGGVDPGPYSVVKTSVMNL